MLRVKYGVLLCLAALVNVAGCGGGGEPAGRPDREPTTATVTYNGAAVDGASVTFYPPAGGNAAYGTTDASGEAVMTTFSDVPGDGAVPGEYKVTVMKIETSGEEEGAEESDSSDEETVEEHLLPQKYNSPENSGLTASVTDGGDNDFKFELTD